MTDRYENIRAALGLLDSEDYCERAIGYERAERDINEALNMGNGSYLP